MRNLLIICYWFKVLNVINRHLNPFLSFFATTFLMLWSILVLMELTPFVEEEANFWPWYFAGHSAPFASEEDGLLILTIQVQFSSIFFHGSIHLLCRGRIFLTQHEPGLILVLPVAVLAIVLELHVRFKYYKKIEQSNQIIQIVYYDTFEWKPFGRIFQRQETEKWLQLEYKCQQQA